MQVLIATSRSVNQDRLYEIEQKKKFDMHLKKIKNLTSIKFPLVQDNQIYQNHLRKAKSAAKLFQKEEQKNTRRIQNKVLLTKLINVEPTIKTMRIRTSSKDKMSNTASSNWITKKKENQKIKKQNDLFQKKYKTIFQTNVKDFKKRMQEQIKEYLELKNNIRKIKPLTSEQSKSQRTKSSKKLSMRLNLPIQNQEQKTQKIDEKPLTQQKIIVESKLTLQKPPSLLLNASDQKAEQKVEIIKSPEQSVDLINNAQQINQTKV